MLRTKHYNSPLQAAGFIPEALVQDQDGALFVIKSVSQTSVVEVTLQGIGIDGKAARQLSSL